MYTVPFGPVNRW